MTAFGRFFDTHGAVTPCYYDIGDSKGGGKPPFFVSQECRQGVAHHGILLDQACGIYSSGWRGLEGDVAKEDCNGDRNAEGVRTDTV